MDKPTIADVARLAGVTKGTVSHVYNGHRPISAATKKKVISAALSLDWSPNYNAQALAVQRANAVGIVLARDPSVLASDTFFPIFLSGVETVLAKHGVALVLQVVNGHEMECEAYRTMAQGRVDGVIVLDLSRNDYRIPLLKKLQLNAVLADSCNSSKDRGFSNVWVDDRAPIKILISHLLELGHRRIAHVSGPMQYVHSYERAQCYIETMGSGELLRTGDFTANSGVECTKDLLSSSNPPTAIIYSNDVMATAGLSYAQSQGFKIPEDLAVAGFDDDPISEHLNPPLTSVYTNAFKRGQITADRLLAEINGALPESVETEPSRIRFRASTGDR
ncbi:MAG: LacI family DNA-binding transcriptional regulator [Bifidobacterium aquikefiri]|uniref:LacI family transcriptional regulator n=1 Tax=Bifidobacterium aquikefiri TaxID=1653207 RepID=A0A261G9G7_9BIFI|nr:LacI family DNA-binding transcriptional regulator [Bifidobacterium aquikefiri]OZG67636.1 LacI family transcriptional regulator [Bifidobacterium aquikefiri]